MKDNTLHFTGADFYLDKSELSEELVIALLDCSIGGQDADDAVTYVLENFDISGDVDTCKDYLKGYGAWGDDELSDHTANLERLVWLAGCNLSEDGSIYFSAY